jgi:hypothetical protein
MGDSQRQESFVTPLSGNDSSVQPLTDPFNAELQHDKPGQEREEEWQQRLCNLQEWICHLLIKNQQLRMSLDLAVSHRSRETNQEGS